MWVREDYRPTVEELTWLASAEGAAVCAAMASGEPADTPAAIERWRTRLHPALVNAAWHQVIWRRAATAKFSRAGGMLLDRVGLEQATDEVVARHKALRFAGCGEVVDFCCGIGGDSIALGAVAALTAIDYSPARVFMTRHNAGVYEVTIDTRQGDVYAVRPAAEAIHIDPDRRVSGRRHLRLEDGSPDLATLARLVAHYHHAAIKISPAADFESLPFEAEVELISHAGECRQAVIWTGRLSRGYRSATVLPGGECLIASDPASMTWPEAVTPAAGLYLFEPDPAVIRAHLVGLLARRLDLAPVDAQVAFLVGTRPIRTPLASCFEILEVIRWSLPAARILLARHDVGRLEIKTRGFAARPDELRHRLKARGRYPATLVLTRLGREPFALLARRVEPDPDGRYPDVGTSWG